MELPHVVIINHQFSFLILLDSFRLFDTVGCSFPLEILSSFGFTNVTLARLSSDLKSSLFSISLAVTSTSP